MLELWGAADPFGRLERYLRGQGFFARGGSRGERGGSLGELGGSLRDDRVADVYLAYGLSHSMRRGDAPDPVEPARLPLLACAIRDPVVTQVEDATGGGRGGIGGRSGVFTVGPWQQTWTRPEYQRAVARTRAAIAAGEVYQVNLVQHMSASFSGDALAVARALEGLRPLHGRAMVGAGWAIVSASPELFLSRRGDRLTTMPIKGTRPRGGAEELQGSAKDAAEHVMIVDLERNDLGRVCVPGSIAWPELMAPRSMAGVEHLVSTVTGQVRPGLGLADLLSAMFPGGSVTGAPKIAALDLIARLEPVGRGASMGAIGVIHANGDFDLALTIRTFAIVDDTINLWVGGGIVWDSDPAAEVEESWVKARPLLTAIESAAVGHGVPVSA